MTSTTHVTLEDVRQQASRLSQVDQLRLISYLTIQMTTQPDVSDRSAPTKQADERSHTLAWERLVAVGNDIANTSQVGLSLTEELAEGRR